MGLKMSKQVNLFHILVVAPITLVIGYRIVQGEKVTPLEGYLLMLIGAIAAGRHLQLFFAGK